MMKRFLFLALAGIAGWMANTSVATAGLIGPGQSTTSVGPTDAPLVLTTPATYGGTVLASTTSSYSIIGGNTGTVTQIVLGPDASNPLGGLTFVMQAHVLTGDLSSVSGAYFSGFLTDVAQGPGTALGGLAAGTVAAVSADSTGGGIRFNFGPPSLTPPDTTLALIIRTDAQRFDFNGQIGIHDGTTANVNAYEPTSATPEPASVVLLGFGAAGMLGYGWKRRKVLA